MFSSTKAEPEPEVVLKKTPPPQFSARTCRRDDSEDETIQNELSCKNHISLTSKSS